MVARVICRYNLIVTRLQELEAEFESLSLNEQREIIARLLRLMPEPTPSELPPPRKFTEEQIRSWIEQDEADMKAFREGR